MTEPLPVFSNDHGLTDDDIEDLTAHVLEAVAEGAHPLTYAADIVHVATDPENGPDDPTLIGIPEAARRWRIEDDSAAEWAMRMLRAASDAVAALDARAADWHREIDEWLMHENREPMSKAGFFEAHLLDYIARRRAATGKASVALPSGTLKSTKQNPRITIVDEPALIAWAKVNLEAEQLGEVVVQSEKAYVSKLKKAATIVDVRVGWTFLLTCEHWHDERVVHTGDGLEDEPVLGEGEVVTCSVCGETSAVVAWQQLDESQVHDEAGRVVPGVAIMPESVSYGVVTK